jgi:hypothetical protein
MRNATQIVLKQFAGCCLRVSPWPVPELLGTATLRTEPHKLPIRRAPLPSDFLVAYTDE